MCTPNGHHLSLQNAPLFLRRFEKRANISICLYDTLDLVTRKYAYLCLYALCIYSNISVCVVVIVYVCVVLSVCVCMCVESIAHYRSIGVLLFGMIQM